MLAVSGVVAGCGSHTVPVARTNPEVRVGPLVVSDVHVVRPPGGSYAAGSTASVDFLLQNTGSDRDQLNGATTPGAGEVQLLLDGRTVQRVLVAAGGTQTRGTQLRVLRLREQLGPGDSLPITFSFGRAGAVTVQAPLA